MKPLVLILLLVLSSAYTRAATTQPAVPSRDAVLAVMKRAADYQLAEQAKKKFDEGWIRAAFYTGVTALYDASKDTKYLAAATAWAEHANWQPKPHNGKALRHADDQACAQVFCELYFLEPDPKRIAASKAMFDAQIADPRAGRVDWWWCDSLFMAPPALVRMTKATGDPKYVEFMNSMFWDSTDFLYDKDAGLYFRDKSYFNKKTRHGQKTFWSRGNGWVMAGLVRVIEYLPDSSPHRPKFVELHRKMSATIAKLQGADGLWRASLLDAEEFPHPETSGTAFFCYALAWGINHGTLDRDTYLPVVLRAWNGLVSHVNDEGRLGSVQKVAGGPGAVHPKDTHEYAVGAFLLAGSEVAKLSR
jgi:rhamnogalacturonyl hydrolase YesR